MENVTTDPTFDRMLEHVEDGCVTVAVPVVYDGSPALYHAWFTGTKNDLEFTHSPVRRDRALMALVACASAYGKAREAGAETPVR